MAPAAAALVAFGLAAAPAHAAESKEAPTPVTTIRDVAYYDGPDADKVRHKLDLYLPKGKKDFPVLFFVHGGAWRHGDKTFMGVYGALGTFFARHGYGTVVINYRLSPAVKHPEHIRDVARAFAWTHKNIARYGGRPDQIFLCGHSAGGHLVALLATNPAYLKAEGLSFADVRGVIPISGVYDLSEMPEWLLRSTFSTDPGVLAEASPVRQAREKLPPFLILYADNDMPGCGKPQAEAFAKALRAKGNEVQTREMVNSNHYKIILETAVEGDPLTVAALGFLAARAEPAGPARATAVGGGK
jgi:acetyl esterase/lipase